MSLPVLQLLLQSSEGVAVLLQRCESRVWVADVHCVASALCVSEPQQQRVEAFMKVLLHLVAVSS